jgi:hypothetical protein
MKISLDNNLWRIVLLKSSSALSAVRLLRVQGDGQLVVLPVRSLWPEITPAYDECTSNNTGMKMLVSGVVAGACPPKYRRPRLLKLPLQE